MIVERPALEQRVLHALDAGRIPVLLGGCGTGRTSALLRLAGVLNDLNNGRAHYIDFAAAATTPERCLQAIVGATAPTAIAESDPPASARAAFDALLTYLDSAVASGGGPVTFLFDEILDIRTFESFPGLRHVQRELVERLAGSPSGFVLASRFTARTHRLLRDATARFEVIHIPPFTEEDVQHLARQSGDHGLGAADAGAVAALGGHRAATARTLLDGVLSQARSSRNPVDAMTKALLPDGPLAARCRESYEFRLHRARGYGALKAILGVLAHEDGLTLTEIARRLHRTPGSTKDYLSWLEDVDLVVMQRKRYVFTDPLLRLHLRIYGGPQPPTADDVSRHVSAWADAILASKTGSSHDADKREPAVAGERAAPDRSGIIEID